MSNHWNTSPKNPADPNRWNAWRYPTAEEIQRGRKDFDMFYCGSSATLAGALELLRGDDGRLRPGQAQWGRDGEVVNP